MQVWLPDCLFPLSAQTSWLTVSQKRNKDHTVIKHHIYRATALGWAQDEELVLVPTNARIKNSAESTSLIAHFNQLPISKDSAVFQLSAVNEVLCLSV